MFVYKFTNNRRSYKILQITVLEVGVENMTNNEINP